MEMHQIWRGLRSIIGASNIYFGTNLHCFVRYKGSLKASEVETGVRILHNKECCRQFSFWPEVYFYISATPGVP